VLPVVIESDATVTPPAVFAFLGIEVKKPAARPAAKGQGHAAPAARAAAATPAGGPSDAPKAAAGPTSHT
jgi:hypothetical protein